MNMTRSNGKCLAFLLLLALSAELVALDYVTVDDLYSNCASSSHEKNVACYSYVEGVTATFVSLSNELSGIQLGPEQIRKMRRLNSERIVSRFKQKYDSGHFATPGKGASYFVVATIIDIVSS